VNQNIWSCFVAAAITTFSIAAHADEQATRDVLKAKIPSAEVLGMQKLPDAELYEVALLGQRLGARSTPAWFLRDGPRYMRALPMTKVVPLLDATAPRH
jgi:hypothetical protein